MDLRRCANKITSLKNRILRNRKLLRICCSSRVKGQLNKRQIFITEHVTFAFYLTASSLVNYNNDQNSPNSPILGIYTSRQGTAPVRVSSPPSFRWCAATLALIILVHILCFIIRSQFLTKASAAALPGKYCVKSLVAFF